MATSSRFVVATHLLVALARHGARPMMSEQLATSASTNPTVVRKLLSMLARAGLTTSQRGAGGGALLARPPGRISLLDVYRAVETEPLVAWHRCGPSLDCEIGRGLHDALAPRVDAAVQAFEAQLAATSIADVAGRIGAGACPSDAARPPMSM